ncbi:aminoglycoside phosphotransferase family protein [Actinoplanes bogorensis]|uniref:Aminoglycoside phosphotransferase family protein n=1 Tax=Paractinoplanes bogorensis TaxID=1610840 RepID=A0ABS5YPZ7_9ACTN|nr:aminoglycoside phosphotransferase family protein [Actinoplanes bogorensis]MBU2665516.1 aminoglycoside phosphotransferase family protein [Actinoplanes bogorensis]
MTEAVRRAWPRSARLDAPHILERIAEITGVRLVLEGPAPGGEVGAAYVRWPDGRRSVLTEGRSRSGPLVDRARNAGVPTARHELAAHVDGARVIVQQRLPGQPPEQPDAHLVRQMLAINDRLAGLLADVPAPKPSDLHLIGDGPGFCLHQPLQEHSTRSAALLRRIHEIGATGTVMIGDDLVHMDFHPGNVLVDPTGRVTGLIDWDGATRGDRHFDLVTLRFVLTGRSAALLTPLDQRLAGLSDRRYNAYWAHMSLRMVDWSIRHHDATAVDHWLDVAESGFR